MDCRVGREFSSQPPPQCPSIAQASVWPPCLQECITNKQTDKSASRPGKVYTKSCSDSAEIFRLQQDMTLTSLSPCPWRLSLTPSNSFGSLLGTSASSPPLLTHTRLRFIGVSRSSSPSSSSSSSAQLSLSPIDNSLSQIQNSGVIACLRASSAEQAMEAASAALSGGISVLEIVVSTPGVFEVLQALVQGHPAAVLGVGTILNAKDAERAINAGARFLMSPAMLKDIMYDVVNGEVLYIPGAMTPTEILFAHDLGAKLIKVYPVSALGGIQYISALKKPFSHIPMVASQGITIDSIGEYIAQGATAVVLSDAIFSKEAMVHSNMERIYQLACLATQRSGEAVEQLREKRCILN